MNTTKSPTLSELYTIVTFLRPETAVQLIAIGVPICGSLMTLTPANIFLKVLGTILGTIAFDLVITPVVGLWILSKIKRDYGDDMPAKVLEWFRKAKDGEVLDLDLLKKRGF